MIVAGIGCRRGCGGEEIVALVRDALARAAQPASALRALATASFKSDEIGIWEAASALGLPLLVMDDPALRSAEPRCATHSAVARRTTGHSAVAEACALAAAGEGSTLLLPRLASDRATCALAEEGGP